MFGILQPDKVRVGQRLKQVKEELNLSLAEYGNRLGLKKPTINSYVQGYSLAPLAIVEKVAKFSNRSIGWFYFGTMEEYIGGYLMTVGHKQVVSNHPEIIQNIKEVFEGNPQRQSDWSNEVGYPAEEFIDDRFFELRDEAVAEDIREKVTKKIEVKVPDVDDQRKNEIVTVISSDLLSFLQNAGDFDSFNEGMVDKAVEEYLTNHEVNEDVKFNDTYLVGELINLLADDEDSTKLVNLLSEQLTGKSFKPQFGGETLIRLVQELRPSLIELYGRVSEEEMQDWFEK